MPQLPSNLAAEGIAWDRPLDEFLPALAESAEDYWQTRSRLPWNSRVSHGLDPIRQSRYTLPCSEMDSWLRSSSDNASGLNGKHSPWMGNMQFCSREFLVFFLIVFSAYWISPWSACALGILLAASYAFYISWSASTGAPDRDILDHGLPGGPRSGNLDNSLETQKPLAAESDCQPGRAVLFQVRQFFLVSLDEALIARVVWRRLVPLRVILPIGISFYTFEAINYTVDVYRRPCRPRAISPISCYLSCSFRTLVAGPIVRRDFLPQMRGGQTLELVSHAFGTRNFFSWDCSRNWSSPTAWRGSSIRSSPSRTVPTGAAWLAVFAYACRCTAISPATRTWPSARRICSATSWPELQHALYGGQRRRLLAALAYVAVELAARLSVHSAGRQPRRNLAYLSQSAHHHGAGRPVARRRWNFVLWGITHGLLLVGHRYWRSFARRRGIPGCPVAIDGGSRCGDGDDNLLRHPCLGAVPVNALECRRYLLSAVRSARRAERTLAVAQPMVSGPLHGPVPLDCASGPLAASSDALARSGPGLGLLAGDDNHARVYAGCDQDLHLLPILRSACGTEAPRPIAGTGPTTLMWGLAGFVLLQVGLALAIENKLPIRDPEFGCRINLLPQARRQDLIEPLSYSCHVGQLANHSGLCRWRSGRSITSSPR